MRSVNSSDSWTIGLCSRERQCPTLRLSPPPEKQSPRIRLRTAGGQQCHRTRMLENSTKALLSTRHGQVLLLTMTGATMLFALLAERATTGRPFAWDRFLFAHLYTGQSPWSWGRTPGQESGLLNAMLPFIQPFSDAGAVLALIAFVTALLLVLGLKRAAVFFVFAVMISGLAPLLKQSFSRPSPFPLPNDPSFPSGHAVASMALSRASSRSSRRDDGVSW